MCASGGRLVRRSYVAGPGPLVPGRCCGAAGDVEAHSVGGSGYGVRVIGPRRSCVAAPTRVLPPASRLVSAGMSIVADVGGRVICCPCPLLSRSRLLVVRRSDSLALRRSRVAAPTRSSFAQTAAASRMLAARRLVGRADLLCRRARPDLSGVGTLRPPGAPGARPPTGAPARRCARPTVRLPDGASADAARDREMVVGMRAFRVGGWFTDPGSRLPPTRPAPPAARIAAAGLATCVAAGESRRVQRGGRSGVGVVCPCPFRRRRPTQCLRRAGDGVVDAGVVLAGVGWPGVVGHCPASRFRGAVQAVGPRCGAGRWPRANSELSVGFPREVRRVL